jgi:DNA-binding transcriptional LysR family regulator
MSRRLPPLNALRAFEVAARHNSFTAAAAELNVSHAAISRHVRALEARLNVTLFHKAKRGVELTTAGAAYLAAVSAAFDSIAQATDSLSASAVATIRLSAHPAFATRWLLHHLGGFRAAHPGYEVMLDASPRLADLARDEADLAIGNGRRAGSTITHELVARSHLCPVAAPSFVDRHVQGAPSALGPAELAQLVLLHDEADGSGWRRWFAAAGLPDIDVSHGPRLLESGLAIDAAIAGQGVALADDFLVPDELAAGRLVCLGRVALSAEDCDYYLRAPAEPRQSRPVAAFRAWLLAESESLRHRQDGSAHEKGAG